MEKNKTFLSFFKNIFYGFILLILIFANLFKKNNKQISNDDRIKSLTDETDIEIPDGER